MNQITDFKALAIAKAVRQHLAQNDGHLINCINKPLLAPEAAIILQQATQDAVTAATMPAPRTARHGVGI